MPFAKIDERNRKIAEAIGISERKFRRIKKEGRVSPEFELDRFCRVFGRLPDEAREVIEHGRIGALSNIYLWHRDPDNFRKVAALSRAYYKSVPDILAYPAITKAGWLPERPIPLSTFDESLAKPRSWTWDETSTPISNAALDFLEGLRYSELVRKAAPDVRQDDDFCYRLLDVASDGNALRFLFGPTSYRDFVDTCEILSFEAAEWCWNGGTLPPRSNGLDLKVRGKAREVFNFKNRNCAVGICTVLIIKKGSRHFFYLQDRDVTRAGPQIMEAPGGYHVVPSGTFQPDTAHNDNHERDFSVWRNVLRELAEELLGVAEVKRTIAASKDFTTHPKVAAYIAGVSNGAVRSYFLGVCIHPPAAKPDLLTTVIIDAKALGEDAVQFLGNWEMKEEIHEVPIENLDRWAKNATMAPTGATCLAIALEHLKAGRLQLP